MDKTALIVQGGWDGHEPGPVSARFARLLAHSGFEVNVSDTLDALLDYDYLRSLDLIVPVWTMGEITREQEQSVTEAVASGVGLAGCHGGMCDAFRQSTEWQFMTGGQWVAHPGGDGTPYRVYMARNAASPVVDGIGDFDVCSEQYYVHVDPAVNVLAHTRFPVAKGYYTTNGAVNVPVMWTKMWGYGRVFYSSLGHHDDVFDIPEARETMLRGMLWAAQGKRLAAERGHDSRNLL